MIEGIVGSQDYRGSQVLYTFRILRITRLIFIASAWRGFKVVMQTLIIALRDMRDFLVLMLSYMVVTSILSTELFAYKVLYDKGISYELDVWGEEWPHDWNTWRSMLPHYLGSKF